jgi:hypothetical protein
MKLRGKLIAGMQKSLDKLHQAAFQYEKGCREAGLLPY